MAVLEHENDRLLRRARSQALRQQVFERGLAQLGVERRGEIVVGDRDPEHGADQRRALHEAGVDRRERALDRGRLNILRLAVIDAQQAAPDLLPHRVARVRTEPRAFAKRQHAGDRHRAHELGDQARLADPGLGHDADRAATPFERVIERHLQCCELGAPPHECELVAALPA